MPRPARRLDPDEERVTLAQRQLIQLGAALVHRPFDTAVHDKLRDFLDGEAAGVLESLRALELRPEADLRARIDELSGHRVAPLGGAA